MNLKKEDKKSHHTSKISYEDHLKEQLTLNKVDHKLHGRKLPGNRNYENYGYFKAYYSSNFLGMDPIYWLGNYR